MDELKVQLENIQDYQFLREQVENYLDTNCSTSSTASKEERTKFVDEIFSILQKNIQVDGKDYEALLSNKSDPINESLENKLEMIQIESDKLLVQIGQMKKSIPEKLRIKYVDEIERIRKSMQFDESKIDFVADNVDLEGSEGDIKAFADQLSKLKSLNNNLPNLINKLERAETVMVDSPQVVDKIKGEPKKQSEIFVTHQRIKKQHDLAQKLLSIK